MDNDTTGNPFPNPAEDATTGINPASSRHETFAPEKDANTRHCHSASAPEPSRTNPGPAQPASSESTVAEPGRIPAASTDPEHSAPTETATSEPPVAEALVVDPVVMEAVSSVWGTDVEAMIHGLGALVTQISDQGESVPRSALTGLACALERLSRMTDSAKVVLTGVMDTQHVAAAPMGGTYGWGQEPLHAQFKDLQDFMVQTLNITRREASARKMLATAIRPKSGLSGEPLEPAHPHLATAISEGQMSTESATIILNSTTRIAAHKPGQLLIGDTHTDPQRWALQTEETMCNHARSFDPDQLRRIGKHCVTLANQDGAEPTERELALKQGLFYRGYRDNLHHLEIVVTNTQYEGFSTTITALVTPTRNGKLHLNPNGDIGNDADGSGPSGSDSDTESQSGEQHPDANPEESTGDVPSGDGADGVDVIATYALKPTPSQVDRSAQGLEPTHAQTLLDAFLIATREGGITLANASHAEDGGTSFVPQARQTIIAIIDQKDLVPSTERGPKTPSAESRSAGSGGGSHGPPESGAESCEPESRGPTTEPGQNSPGAESRGPATESEPITGSSPPPGPGAAFFQRTGAVTPGEIRRLACNAELLPVVFDGESQPIDVGRAKRLFTTAQRMALNARDRGCTFPGCTTALAFCEAHHINPWGNGGLTDLNNGALLCSYHHHYLHTSAWKMEIINNTPWLIPPAWKDESQTPLRNTIQHFTPRTNTS